MTDSTDTPTMPAPAAAEAKPVNAPAARTTVAPPASPSPAALAAAAMKVLVAEDNPTNRLLISTLLKRAGIVHDLAVNGREAVDAIRRERYDVVLMDMQMPELDGPGATREIRAMGGAISQPRIVALTANAFESDRVACMEAGMDDFLSKPFKSEQLMRAIAEAQAVRPA